MIKKEMTKEELIEKYKTTIMYFDKYYKYGFTFKAETLDGTLYAQDLDCYESEYDLKDLTEGIELESLLPDNVFLDRRTSNKGSSSKITIKLKDI